ncbi:ArsC/Spx/MgsR family protein [Sulfurimonas sp. HSL-1656]|uniref:ArsC/Spx/MgsR family protein n=1 Tax=Thiomicrolovo subterrani TaxID=3131934 RepID=UPI0031F77F6F
MTLVLFYEKPGCATNARQKKLLYKAGCTLIVQNLLALNMGPDELRTYLDERPVAEWFNPNAPAVKEGRVDPTAFNAETALSMLLQDPILIRRPLISVNGHRMCGFDQAKIEGIINTPLGTPIDNSCSSENGEPCPEP